MEEDKHWAPKVIVDPGQEMCVRHFFEMMHGIQFNWCEDLGFTFKTPEDNVTFNLKFDEKDWHLPFIHVGQVYEINIVCIKEKDDVVAWIDNKLVQHDHLYLRRMLDRL